MARLAACRLMQLARHWIPASGPEVEEGIRMARQAIISGRDDPEVLDNAGYALAYLAGENETALYALDRAIRLNPNFADAASDRALVLNWVDRPTKQFVRRSRPSGSVRNIRMCLVLSLPWPWPT